MQLNDSVKVMSQSGKYSDYVSRPRREGQVLKIAGDIAQVRFPQGKRDSSYYSHDHWFRIQDLRIIHHRKKGGDKP